jgi:hypothetical protein
MSGVHLHLLVNHAPVFGSIFALALVMVSLFTARDVLRRTALVLLVVTGAAGAAANYTGEPAEDAVRGYPGIRRGIIHEHEEMGEKAWLAAALVGVLALGGLARWRRGPVPNGAAYGTLVGAALVSGLMAYTALLGGRVRHTEVRPDATAADASAVEPRRMPPAAPR